MIQTYFIENVKELGYEESWNFYLYCMSLF